MALYSLVLVSLSPHFTVLYSSKNLHTLITYPPNSMLSPDPTSLHMLVGFSASAPHPYVPKDSLLPFKIQLKCYLSSEDFLGCWPVCQPHAKEIWATLSVLSCLRIGLAFQIHNTIQN